MNKWGLISLIFAFFLLSNFFIGLNVNACKDIVAVGDATAGDYNLLLKVRDPSRDGLQVLCIVPEGYEYTYRYPWTGKPLKSEVLHKFIGVATKGDTIPNIVKAGMSLSDVGLAFGDADTGSNWKNPTKYAWDDFDWIRYACEKADDEEAAVLLMTKDAVDKMHASAVSENLFIVGPNKGFVVEADAFRYKIKEIDNGVLVMSNYPKELWKSQIRNRLPIARSFDTVVEKYVRNRGVVRLKSLYGVKIVKIGEDFISVKPVSFIHALKTESLDVVTKINMGERKTVGYFSVELLDIDGNKAKIRVCYKSKAWEDKMLEYIQPRYGDITIRDMINWSRLHSDDLDGLRPMCQNFYEFEAVAIYKIPKENYEIMSSGWFSPNHACSSIYVPFHICDTDIYDPYETGEAAKLCLNLLGEYGHGALNTSFTNVEAVFLYETQVAEQISTEQITDNIMVSDFLTVVDMGMQRQALLTEQIWMDISKLSNKDNLQIVTSIVEEIWGKNYSISLTNMKNSVNTLKELPNTGLVLNKICEIALDICKSRIDAAGVVDKDIQAAEEKYEKGSKLIRQGEFEPGFDSLQESFTLSDMLIKNQEVKNVKNVEIEKNNKVDISLILLILVLILAMIALFAKFRINFE